MNSKADFFWSARIDVCFDDLIFLSELSEPGGIKGLGGNCPHIFAELGAKSDPSKDLSCIIACPPQIFRPSATSVKTIIVQIDGLTEQGRVNSWPLSWIQKLETAIKRKRENKNCENAKCHSVTTRDYRGEENIQNFSMYLFRALLFLTNDSIWGFWQVFTLNIIRDMSFQLFMNPSFFFYFDWNKSHNSIKVCHSGRIRTGNPAWILNTMKSDWCYESEIINVLE